MNSCKTKGVVLAAAVALFAGLATVPARAASQSAQTQNDQEQAQTDHARPETKTVIGTVIKIPETRNMPGENFIIYDENTDVSYFLDHPSAVARLQGQRARVQGTLNEADNTIEVQSIESVPAFAAK